MALMPRIHPACEGKINRQHAHRLEGQVRSSDEKYENLMEQANDAIVLMDFGGTILEVNRRAETFFGAPRDTVVGRSYLDFVERDQHESLKEQFGRLLEHDPGANERDEQPREPEGANCGRHCRPGVR
jgi:PAS domain S-box-containing protein